MDTCLQQNPDHMQERQTQPTLKMPKEWSGNLLLCSVGIILRLRTKLKFSEFSIKTTFPNTEETLPITFEIPLHLDETIIFPL